MGVPNKKTLTKTRRKTRDVDQIKKDLLSAKHLSQYKDTKLVEDLPGLGRHYCVECSKWFGDEPTLVAHKKAKPHKRRLKQLKNPYTHEEANAAGGLTWTDNGKREKNPDLVDDVDMAT